MQRRPEKGASLFLMFTLLRICPFLQSLYGELSGLFEFLTFAALSYWFNGCIFATERMQPLPLTRLNLCFMRYLFALVFLCSMHWELNAQPSDFLWKGWILDRVLVSPLPDVHVLNKTRNVVTISGKNGAFSLYGSVGDSIIISSVGYETRREVIPDTASQPVFLLESKTYLLEGAVIFPDTMRLNGLDRALRSDEGNYSMRPGWGAGVVVGGPVTFLYNAFSKEGKQQRTYLAKVTGKDEDLLIGEKFNGEIVTRITQLQGEELIRFMVWCGFSRRYLLTANDGQIEKQIVNKWMQYRALQTKAGGSVLRNTP